MKMSMLTYVVKNIENENQYIYGSLQEI